MSAAFAAYPPSLAWREIPRALGLVKSRPAKDRSLPAPWTSSSAMTLALAHCGYCSGLGQRQGQLGSLVCACVYRAVFRACLERYRDYCSREKYMSRVTLDTFSGLHGQRAWGRKQEEYCADFELIARRVLTEFEQRLFRLHFLGCGDWKLATRRLKMDRGNFFHAVYRVEQKLGRAYSETKPYALYPADEYLHGVKLGVGSCLENSRGLRIRAGGPGPRPLA